MQASDDLAKLKGLLLCSPSLSSAATGEPDRLSDAVIGGADGDAGSEREGDDVDSDREDDDVALKGNTTELSSIPSDSFFCHVS